MFGAGARDYFHKTESTLQQVLARLDFLEGLIRTKFNVAYEPNANKSIGLGMIGQQYTKSKLEIQVEELARDVLRLTQQQVRLEAELANERRRISDLSGMVAGLSFTRDLTKISSSDPNCEALTNKEIGELLNSADTYCRLGPKMKGALAELITLRAGQGYFK